MSFFNFDLKKLVMIAIVLVLPLISINIQPNPKESPWLTKPFTLLGSSVMEIYFTFSNGVKETTALYVDLIGIKKQSEDLRSQNNELQTRLEKMNELGFENERLRQLLNFKTQTKMSLTAAQVIGRDLVLDHNTVTINKGQQDGLKAGQAVITMGGVLGYIFKPEAFTSHVILITDRYAVVDGIVQRTRAHGIVEGNSQFSCSLKYVERTEDVKEGDVVVTGGLDNIFPKGYPIAVVTAVERKDFSVSLKVDLRPVVDPYKVEEVFVITSAANEDFTTRFAPVAATDPLAPATEKSPTAPVITATPLAKPSAVAPSALATPPAPVASPQGAAE